MSINVYANALLESFLFLFLLLHFIQCFLDAKEKKSKRRKKTSFSFLPQITYRMAKQEKKEN